MTVLLWGLAAYLLVGLVFAAADWHRNDTQEAVDETSDAIPEFDTLLKTHPRAAAVSYYCTILFAALELAVTWPYVVIRRVVRRRRYRRDWQQLQAERDDRDTPRDA